MIRPRALAAGAVVLLHVVACRSAPAETNPQRPAERYEVTPAVLAELPVRTAELRRKDQPSEPCAGPALYDFLRSVGAVPQTGKPDLMSAVIVEASDGFEILLSMGEVDSILRKDAPVLATECGGTPLGPDRGPVLLVVPGDQRRSRRVRHVHAIRLAHPT